MTDIADMQTLDLARIIGNGPAEMREAAINELFARLFNRERAITMHVLTLP